MQDKRRWLPSWQRVELVELCLNQGVTRRQAAAWRRVSVSTVQYWIGRYGTAGDADGIRRMGARPALDASSPARAVRRAGP
jgi:transposase